MAISLIADSTSSPSSPAFKAFSSNVATYARNQPEYTNMLKFGLRGSIKPIDSLYTSVGTDVVFDSGKDFGFRGVQWDASVKYQIFTDLQLAFVAKQFFDVKKDTNNNTSFSINASLAF